MATISTRSLRVRSTPTDDGDIIGGVRQGDSYPVVGISSDGAWIELEIPDVDGGAGWVSASLVTLVGDITNITITDVAEFAEEPAAEETPTEETAEEEAASEEEAAAEDETAAEETVAEEATAEEGDEEAAAEESATPEPAAEETAAEETTEEPAVEASTPVTATEETTATVEAAPDEAPIAESTDITETIAITDAGETTEEPATTEATPAAPSLGTVTINADPPLRVRSSPTTEEDNKVGNVFNGETYTVLEISEDGLWVRIDVPQLGLEDGGWVSAEFVVYN
jgi:uncharacterized protein YgiM (DUF1202 family)